MSNKELASIFAKNRNQIKKALIQLKLQLNESIKKEDELKTFVNIRLYVILYLAWLETSLKYIMYQYSKQIDQNLLTNILSKRSQSSMWAFLIASKFREHYLSHSNVDLNEINLGSIPFSKFSYLNNLLVKHINSFIEIRNKLAHGQWAISLNSKNTNKVQSSTSKIWNLTKQDTLLVKNILEKFVLLIDALVASKKSFEQIYDVETSKLDKALIEFNNRYNWIIKEMKQRYNSFSRVAIKK